MKKKLIPKHFLPFLFFAGGALIFTVCRWYNRTYGISLKTLMYTLVSPLAGTSFAVVGNAAKACLPPLLGALLFYLFVVFLGQQETLSVRIKVTFFQKSFSFDGIRAIRCLELPVCVLALIGSLAYTVHCLHPIEYIQSIHDRTTLYEEYYINPNTVSITPVSGTKPKNLIYIYMESMETSYASMQDGGAQSTNYIPNLTSLALEPDIGGGGYHSPMVIVWAVFIALWALHGQWVPYFPPQAGSRFLTPLTETR